MCVVSMIGDHYHDKWKHLEYIPSRTVTTTDNDLSKFLNPPSDLNKKFEELKKEVEEMKELLKKAIEYDKKNNEPHCEIEEKIATLKKIAEWVGIDLTDVLK